MKTYFFPGWFLYCWEVGRDFITVYDDINRNNYQDIIAFFAAKEVLVVQGEQALLCSSTSSERRFVPLKKSDTRDREFWVENAHDSAFHYAKYHGCLLLCFACFWGVRAESKPHCHFRFARGLQAEAVSIVLGLLAEFSARYEQAGNFNDIYRDVVENIMPGEKTRLVSA